MTTPIVTSTPLVQDRDQAPADPQVGQSHVVDAYRRYAPLYDLLFGQIYEAGRRQMGRSIQSLAPERLLEVGVGTGLALTQYPAQTEVHGIDICPQMLGRAQMHASAMPGRKITLRLMDAERLDYPDAHFDCVTLPYVLSVTADPKRLVREIRRVCKPDGTILILNHFSGARFWRPLEWLVRRIPDKVGFHSDFDYETHILAYDWKVLSSNPVNLFGLSRLVTLRNG